MAGKRTPSETPAATLRIVAPTATDTSHNHWTGRVGALSALARSEVFRRGSRFLAYAVLVGLIGVLLLVATATVPVLFGYHTYSVNGGSMEPSLRAGSVAVTAPTSPRGLQVGDIIAWRSSAGSSPVLHRIVEIKNEDGQRQFVTQGDQNLSPDREPVVLGGPGDKVVYSVPYAGYILNFAGGGPGRVLLMGAPLALLAAMVLRERWHWPRQQRRAGAESDAAVSQEASSRVITIAKAIQHSDADLPVFLFQQLAQLRGPGGRRRTDHQRQREERLAA